MWREERKRNTKNPDGFAMGTECLGVWICRKFFKPQKQIGRWSDNIFEGGKNLSARYNLFVVNVKLWSRNFWFFFLFVFSLAFCTFNRTLHRGGHSVLYVILINKWAKTDGQSSPLKHSLMQMWSGKVLFALGETNSLTLQRVINEMLAVHFALLHHPMILSTSSSCIDFLWSYDHHPSNFLFPNIFFVVIAKKFRLLFILQESEIESHYQLNCYHFAEICISLERYLLWARQLVFIRMEWRQSVGCAIIITRMWEAFIMGRSIRWNHNDWPPFTALSLIMDFTTKCSYWSRRRHPQLRWNDSIRSESEGLRRGMEFNRLMSGMKCFCRIDNRVELMVFFPLKCIGRKPT